LKPLVILVVEDEPAIAELIAMSLRSNGFEPQLADGAQQARALVDQALPALCILDWMLPGMDGVEFARLLRSQERTKQLPIIMLTARASEDDMVRALNSGADDFVSKPFSPKGLIARIHALLRRRMPEASDLIELGVLKLDRAARKAFAGEQELTLGPTEYKLLAYFMAHPERVQSRTNLQDKVWGDHVFIEERTVDVHIKRLREALRPAGLDEWVQTVRGEGYRFSAKALAE
jgi:two-component system, OmpR family, phosphate regulon response regulator PhoB